MEWLQCVLDWVYTGWLVHWLDYEQEFCFSNHNIVYIVTILQNVYGSLFIVFTSDITSPFQSTFY